MSNKVFFIVSRRFQVERYLKYVSELKIKKSSYKFICVSEWTGGDASISLEDQPYSLLPKPKFLKKPFFGSILQYCICIILAWLNIFFQKPSTIKNGSNIVFIDQYFSPLEFLAISTCSDIKAVVLHQHSFNYLNQLHINRKRQVFAKISHQLLQKYFLIRAQKELNYYGAFFSLEAKRLASKLSGFTEFYLIAELQISRFLHKPKSNNISKSPVSFQQAAIISPGMYRYKSVPLKKAQTIFFEKAISSLSFFNEKVRYTVRPKPGEFLGRNLKSLSAQMIESKSSMPFSEFIKNFELFVCPSVSTTWCQVLAAGKSLIIIRQEQFENEYPFFSDLLSKLISKGHSFENLIDNKAFFVRAENAAVVYKDICFLLDVENKKECIDIVELMSCVR